MHIFLHPRLASQNTAPIKRWVMLGLVLLSLLSTQWLGLVHHIEHQEFKPSATLHAHESLASCESHDHSLLVFLGHEENSSECKLFDALTLAGIITGGLVTYAVPNLFHQSLFSITSIPIQSVSYRLYQSRAPPFLIL